MNDFYVYEWYNIETNEVFYVGKGKKDRYKIKYGRNKYFNNYINKHDCDVRIIKNNLTENDAFSKEIELIQFYRSINQCKCNIADGGEGGIHLYGEDNPMYGRTWWDENTPIEKIDAWKIKTRHIGENNSMYGVSPKERMDDETYNVWKEKHKNIRGEKNPNYRNDTLKKKYKENPNLALLLQSRKGEQNGMAKKVYLYDINKKFIKEFNYIGECSQYLIDSGYSKGKVKSISGNITESIKKNKPYLKHIFSFEKLH